MHIFNLPLKKTILTVTTLTIVFLTFVILKEAISIQDYKEDTWVTDRVQGPLNIHTNSSLPDGLGVYYVSLGYKYLNRERFDKEAIPLMLHTGHYHYHPVAISHYALGAYEHFLMQGSESAKKDFLRCADWLESHLKQSGDFFYWEYTYPWDDADQVPPWYSAMAQGEGGSVLLRAFDETKDKKYLRAAKEAFKPVLQDLSLNGLSVIKGNDYIFPQEYVQNPPSNVLNGAIGAFLGLYDYFRVTRDPIIKAKCEIIIKTFLHRLQEYDTGYWSLYSLNPGDLADPHYHSVHIEQLKILYQISGDQAFLRTARAFINYQNSFTNKVRYVVENHIRQAREFSPEDIGKIPEFIERILFS